MNFFIIGDIHGCYQSLQNILEFWNPKKEQLIQLGDMVDRGPDSFLVVKKMMHLQKENQAIILKGNHEQNFLDFLDNPRFLGNYYLNQGGRQTIQSFLGEDRVNNQSPETLAEAIKSEHSEVVSFIRHLPYYYECGKWVFVHAGVNLRFKDWHNTREQDFLWIRELFYLQENHHPNTFVFGHTPTQLIHGYRNNDIWVSSCKTKIGIDGACVYGGQLNALRIDNDTYEAVSVKNEKKI